MTLLAIAEQIQAALSSTAGQVEITKQQGNVRLTASVGDQTFEITCVELAHDRSQPDI